MSPDVVISVEGLWKQYRYGSISHATLRKDFQSWWARVRGKEDPNLPVDHVPVTKNQELRTRNEESEADDRFWALRDVSFDVKQGEVLGIIGKNGAGKSTLLKIMSKVTTPTKGQIKIKGRIASLLEVGTGFHPELTGRENIFLNGAILGMTKEEIKRKFDEIVAFAEVEKFIDTPVKRYSSGMYVRLAFAVAAHLEPEILIVDEVLAVGDAAFQKKCLGKMGDVAKEGRTVLFVSHNMGAVEALCPSSLFLDSGTISGLGETKEIVKTYLSAQTRSSGSDLFSLQRSRDDDFSREIIFQTAWTETLDGNRTDEFEMSQPLYICFKYVVTKALPSALISLRLTTVDGQIIIDSWESDSIPVGEKSLGTYSVRVKFDRQDLHPGTYSICLVAAVHLIRWIDRVDNAIQLHILPFNNNVVWRAERKAILQRTLQWEVRIE